MKIDPTISFWIGVAVTICVAIGTGATKLTGAIPADWIPSVTAWVNIFALCGTAFLTAAHGLSSAKPGPLT